MLIIFDPARVNLNKRHSIHPFTPARSPPCCSTHTQCVTRNQKSFITILHSTGPLTTSSYWHPGRFQIKNYGIFDDDLHLQLFACGRKPEVYQPVPWKQIAFRSPCHREKIAVTRKMKEKNAKIMTYITAGVCPWLNRINSILKHTYTSHLL